MATLPCMHDALPGTTRPFEIIPSVLPADFSRLGDACRDLEQAGVDRIQFDIMDGRFVPNLTFGPDVVASLRPHVGVPFEAHLMVEEPGWMYRAFVDAGCDMIIVHAESVGHLHRALDEVRSAGARAAVALNPATPVSDVEWVLDLVEMVLVMTVNPGFGGQAYIPTMEPKVAELRNLVLSRGLDVDIEVDGGIDHLTAPRAAVAGADVMVAGTSVFGAPGGAANGLRRLIDSVAGIGPSA